MGDIAGSVLKGAASGGAMGSVAGPWGTGAGIIVGGATSLVQSLERERAMEQARIDIEARPDYAESEAYANAAAMAEKTKRMAEEGLSATERNYAQDNIQRGVGQAVSQANSLESGIQGMSSVHQSAIDAYRSLETKNEEVKRQNVTQNIAAEKDWRTALDTDFSLQLGKAQDLANINLGTYEARVDESSNMIKGILSGAQGLVDYGGSNWKKEGGGLAPDGTGSPTNGYDRGNPELPNDADYFTDKYKD